MWKLDDCYNVTINIEKNYVISVLASIGGYLKIYDMNDRHLVFETRTKWYFESIVSREDKLYIVTKNNYLLTFDLNNFEFIDEKDLSESGGIWKDENVHNVFLLPDKNYLLFNCDVELEKKSEHDEEDPHAVVILYDINSNLSIPLVVDDDGYETYIKKVNGYYVELDNFEYITKVKVNIDEKSLEGIEKIEVESKNGLRYVGKNDNMQLKIYQKGGVMMSSIIIEDYNNKKLFNKNLKAYDFYPIFIEDKNILLVLVGSLQGSDIYSFKRADNELNLIKTTFFKEFDYIDDRYKEHNKIILKNSVDSIILELEDLV